MNVEIFTACVQAAKKGDQFTITDTFDEFTPAAVPFTAENFDVVIRLRVEAIEATGEKHLLSLCLFDQDGKEVCHTPPIEFQIHPPQRMRTNAIGLAFHFQQVLFHQFGDYTLVLYVDRVLQASIPLFVSPPAF